MTDEKQAALEHEFADVAERHAFIEQARTQNMAIRISVWRTPDEKGFCDQVVATFGAASIEDWDSRDTDGRIYLPQTDAEVAYMISEYGAIDERNTLS